MVSRRLKEKHWIRCDYKSVFKWEPVEHRNDKSSCVHVTAHTETWVLRGSGSKVELALQFYKKLLAGFLTSTLKVSSCYIWELRPCVCVVQKGGLFHTWGSWGCGTSLHTPTRLFITVFPPSDQCSRAHCLTITLSSCFHQGASCPQCVHPPPPQQKGPAVIELLLLT